MMTIRRRLLLLLLPALALLMLLGGVVDYWVAAVTTRSAYDRALGSSAIALAAGIRLEHGRVQYTPLAAGYSVPSQTSDSIARPDLYRITGPDGALIAGMPSLPTAWASGVDSTAGSAAATATAGGAVFRDVRYHGQSWRVGSIIARTPAGPVSISVAESPARRARTQRVMLVGKLVIDFAELDLMLLLIWVAVYFGLRPLSRIQARAEQQAGRQLQRFDEAKVPGELRSLVVTFNRVAELLQDAASAQRRFVADAAHQMRTPVAGLLAQIELLAQDPRAAAVSTQLATLQRGTQALARSAHQMLALARAEPVSALHREFKPIALDALIRELVERHLNRADQAHIDLGADTNAVSIEADAWLLEDLIGNLIDNALKYTPAGGRVTVRSGLDGGRPYIEVEDDGPGIPEPERQRVRERFYRRPGSPGVGTGLGLAIVDEIARVHDAIFSIGSGPDGRGARMRVRFRVALMPDITSGRPCAARAV